MLSKNYTGRLDSIAQTETEQERKKSEAASRISQKLNGFNYNPFLKSDGSLVNPYLPYQKMLNSSTVSNAAKEWITAATGLTPDKETRIASAMDTGKVITTGTGEAASNTELTGRIGETGSKGSGKGQQLVDTAKKYLGTKYVWGGTTPDGFDCSGLMQYVCAENGIDVSRTTYTQIKDGTAVARNDLQPGDFILFGTQKDPHHIGMYVGNGQYIHAPKTGDVVKISNLSDRSDYLTARRVV